MNHVHREKQKPIRKNETFRQSETLYRELFETASDLIQSVGPDGKYQYVNAAWRKALGYDSHDVARLSLAQIIAPHELERCMAIFQSLAQTESARSIETEFVTRTGERLAVEGHVRSKLLRGKLESVRGIFRNVTERRKIETALRDSEEQFRKIVENSPISNILVDSSGIIRTVNRTFEKLFGYTRDEAVGRSIAILLPAEFHAVYRSRLATYLKAPVVRSIGDGFRRIGLRKDGTAVPVEVGLTSLTVAGEQHLMISTLDLTERERVDRMKDEFISTVSHELRTPLTSIKGALGLLVGGAGGTLPPEARELIEIAHKNSDRLIVLINDILDLQKIEAGQMEFSMVPLDLGPVLEKSVASIRGYAIQAHVEYQLALAQDMWINGDAGRLEQVMANLLSNATKFSPPGGIVEIISTVSPTVIRIAVRDHGPGIPASFQPKMFVRFSQADTGDARQTSGTGLGLNISKTIVERHGGRIGFDTAIGQGTTFWFELPRLSAPYTTQVAPVSAFSGKTILICEDDQDISNLIGIMLRQAGFGTQFAYTVAEARQLLQDGEYSAMTLDLMLPDMHGLEFLHELRAQPRTHDLPVVIVSAFADADRKRLDVTTLAVADWLTKPIDHTQLLQAVHQAAQAGSSGRIRILHVEDEADFATIVARIMAPVADCTHARTLAEARAILARDTFDVILLDVHLPDGSGIDLMAEIATQHGGALPVVLMSAQDVSAEIARKAAGVLVKSRTPGSTLADTILQAIAQRSGFKPQKGTNT